MKKLVSSFVTVGLLGVTIPSAGATDTGIDVSRIMDKAAAEAVLGETVKAATPRNFNGKEGYYSKCNYYSTAPGKILLIRVYQAAAGFDPHKELEMVTENTGAMRAIAGLGDKARLSNGSESGLPSHVVMLYVIKGNALITIGLAGLEDDAAAAEKAKSVAQKILPNL